MRWKESVVCPLLSRRLLLTGTITASAAAFAVGYQSVSQFMREYRRLFDTSPMRDARAQE
ncbi:AraC family transcriptional regulator [Salinisphaera sp. Q1T1-3]|nr:AraC family transcriptional regulator [Salinisphaera sp. Q1T1-3]